MNPFTCSISWECLGLVFGYQMFMNFVRYFPLAAGLFLIVWVWQKGYFQRFRIQEAFPKAGRVLYEARYSALTLVIFSVVATGAALMSKMGWNKVHLDPMKYGTAYIFLSFLFITVWHETYFYWVHRAMHSKRLFKHVHAVHHHSTNPSPIAAYSFHPLEAVLEVLYLPLFVIFVPMSLPVLIVHTFYAMILNILWHTGYEFFPRNWVKGPITRWINTSTHHNMHHSHVHGNYSLYFNFWDRIMGTNFPKYEAYYDAVRARAAKEAAVLDRVSGGSAGGEPLGNAG